MSSDSVNEHDPMREVQSYSERIGVPIDPSWHIEAQQVGELAAESKAKQLALLQADRGKVALFVEQFNRIYPKFLRTLLGIGEVLLTGAHTLLIAFGVPIVLICLMIAESERVYFGALLIDKRPELASLAAWVLVMGNLITELIIHWDQHRLNWQEPPRYEFSLRILALQLGYFIGFYNGERQWAARRQSPSFWARKVLRFVTITILLLAIAGSMQSVMDIAGESNWLTAIGAIITKATLSQMLTLLGGLMLAVTFVIAAQGLSQYVAKKVIEIVNVMTSSVDDKAIKVAETAGLAMASHLMTKLKEASKARKTMLASAADMPQLTGYSGRVIVPAGQGDNASGTEVNDFLPDSADGTDGTGEGTKTKIEQAIVLLKENRTLRGISSRKLAEMFPEKDIKHKTWVEAKRRLGIKQ